MAPLADRKVRVRDGRKGGPPGCDERFGRRHLFGEPRNPFRVRAAKVFQPSAQPCSVCDSQAVEPLTQVCDGWFGHSLHDRRC
jgi:hypothetical protein